MKKPMVETQVLYELAISIGNSLDMKEMLRESLYAYLRMLDCSAGMVLRLKGPIEGLFQLEPVYSIPMHMEDDGICQVALRTIPDAEDKERLIPFLKDLPIKGDAGEGHYFHIFELPHFGILILIKKGTALEHAVTRSLEPINNKLTNSCITCLQNETLRTIVDQLKGEVAERKKADRALRESQKMEAIATLAGGIAHEFNNALTGVSGNLELLQMSLPPEEEIEMYIKPMKTSIHRMAQLTNQLLAYARGGKYRPQILFLNDFVADTLPFLKHGFEAEIRVETDLPVDVSPVTADSTQMQMVLSALINNAAEAIDEKGRIRIQVKEGEIEEPSIINHPEYKRGHFVYLIIEDDGRGMNEETRAKIFEPFFTTKFQGRGLGMAAVYGIIRNHGGWIRVESEPGKGTSVYIYLPVITVSKEVKKKPAEPMASSGTVLFIEDDEIVMDIGVAMLDKLGYVVLKAKHGNEALRTARTYEGEINLALLDIKLPDMDGERLYPLLKEVRPKMKVIVCSGYAINGPAQAILNAGADGFIQKPFYLSTLSQKLAEVLSAEI